MNQSTTDRRSISVADELDSEVVDFRQQFEGRSALDELIREGARKMLQAAIDAEVEAFLLEHQPRRDEQGPWLVIKNGTLPAREILSGAGPIEVQQGRVRDNTLDPEHRVQFSVAVQSVKSVLADSPVFDHIWAWTLSNSRMTRRGGDCRSTG
ncbi:hypothetical protein Pla8534_22780 [Lignipirellula cremea]|uniref:Mutator family transposase n=1 Tax=Lignipirellula cremea TaxID=2528010 RepID=A0A518DRL6_9BACT|nr:hypothetical protein [Lignipirellula cremea]QDU94487.1 hypothetical protein Pla8534_22780 [Lignipirellula cremea]